MAIYEYDCPTCGTFEVKQKMTDPHLERHDVCGQPVQRRISMTSFSLKGGGWYSDGYASSKTSTSASGAGVCGSDACASGGCAAKAQA